MSKFYYVIFKRRDLQNFSGKGWIINIVGLWVMWSASYLLNCAPVVWKQSEAICKWMGMCVFQYKLIYKDMQRASFVLWDSLLNCVLEQYQPLVLAVMIAVSYVCSVHYRATSHTWLLFSWNMAGAIDKLNFISCLILIN